MEHEAGGDPWGAIARALGVDRHDLLFWEKVAKVVHAPRLPGFQSQEKPQLLLVGFLHIAHHLHGDVVKRQEHGKPCPDPSTLRAVANPAWLVFDINIMAASDEALLLAPWTSLCVCASYVLYA